MHPACRILEQYISDKSIEAALPQIAMYLLAEGVIGSMLMPTTGGAELLAPAVQRSVCANHCNLDKFASILQKLSSTLALGTLIRKDYSM